MRHDIEQMTFLKETINKFKTISLSSQTKLYLTLSTIPLSDIAFQSLSKDEINGWEILGLTGICAIIGHAISKRFPKILKNTQKRLNQFQRNIENLELLIKNIPGAGFFMLDEHGKYVRVNDLFAAMTGRKINDILGKTDIELFPLLPDDVRNRLFKSNQDSLNKIEEVDSYESEMLEDTISLPLTDGEHILMLKKATFVEQDQKRIIGICIDITELINQQTLLEEQKQSAEEAAKLKGAFLANMSHELRTPLNRIIGFSQLLGTHEEDPQKSTYIEKIKKGGEDLLALINDTLDMAKLNAGMLRIADQPVVLKDTIMDIVENQKHSTNKNPKVSLVNDKSIDILTETILSDNMRIKQVLNNLIGNAIKFTENGSVCISCPKVEDLGDKQKFYLAVQDTGIGIPKNKINTIFDRFTQVDNSYSKKYSGTGLGLSLAKEISQLMGGDITVESSLNKGSTFTFSFTARKPDYIDSKVEVEAETNIA